MARHAGVEIGRADWMEHGYDLPLLVNMQPAGQYLSERFHRAGGVPAVMWELLQAGKLDGDALTVTGRTQAENLAGPRSDRSRGDLPLRRAAEGACRLPRAARQSVRLRDHEDQRDLGRVPRALSLAARARRRVRRRARSCSTAPTIITIGSTIPSLEIDENCILVIRGSGPLGWPGSAEVVNMQPPDALLQRGITSLPTLGDGRQSGTSDSPSILNASPESAAGGGLSWLRTGDTIRIDLNDGHAATRWSTTTEIARRKAEAPPPIPRAIRRGKSSTARRPGSLAKARCSSSRSSIAARRTKTPRHNH